MISLLSLQVVMWVNQNFLLTEEVEPMDGALDVMFLSLRTGSPLALKMDQGGNVSALC